MIDLHTHSTFSDGSLTPTQLVDRAVARGLTALALTDHDTADGIPEFLEAASARNLAAIPGVELACVHGTGHLHLVGLFIRRECGELSELLERIRSSRTERNQAMIRRLVARGCPITEEQVAAEAGPDGVTGRPHIAAALVASGVCSDRQEAFGRFLSSGKPGYARRYRPSASRAIRAIQAAGGVAIWAHPLAGRPRTETGFRLTVESLGEIGLDGIEVHYSEFTPEQTALAVRVAGEAGLLASGGSDFHGETFPTIDLGVGYGELAVPDAVMPALRERAESRGGDVSGLRP